MENHGKWPSTRHLKEYSGWWFQIFFMFIPTWGNDPIWLIFFRWVETTKPDIGFTLSNASAANPKSPTIFQGTGEIACRSLFESFFVLPCFLNVKTLETNIFYSDQSSNQMIATKTIQKPHKDRHQDLRWTRRTSRFVNEGNQLRNLVTMSPSSKKIRWWVKWFYW